MQPGARHRHALLRAAAIAIIAVVPVLRAQTPPATPPVTPPATTPRADASVPRVKSGFLVKPDTVAVGDPFQLVVSVVVPNSARVEWPSINDTAAVVAMRAPVRVRSAPDGISRRETAEYDLAAWDVGALLVGLPDATVRYGNTVLKVPLASARIVVRSVLPGDTTLHVPKPAKALFPRIIPWWERWWPALAVLAALLLLWWLWRRKRARVAMRVATPVDVFARAVHDFERLDRLALADAGERGRAVALAVEIMRVYLVARVPDAALSLTSAELLVATASDTRVPHDLLAALLADADAIKFARRVVNGTRATELTANARALVESIERVHQELVVAEAERRRLAARAEQEAKEADEDDARRRSRRKVGAA